MFVTTVRAIFNLTRFSHVQLCLTTISDLDIILKLSKTKLIRDTIFAVRNRTTLKTKTTLNCEIAFQIYTFYNYTYTRTCTGKLEKNSCFAFSYLIQFAY